MLMEPLQEAKAQLAAEAKARRKTTDDSQDIVPTTGVPPKNSREDRLLKVD